MGQRETDLEATLRDLGRALEEAIAASPEVHRTLERMDDSGTTVRVRLDPQSRQPIVEPITFGSSAAPNGEPCFKIDTQDLSFLRSIGIDPTRRRRRRTRDKA